MWYQTHFPLSAGQPRLGPIQDTVSTLRTSKLFEKSFYPWLIGCQKGLLSESENRVFYNNLMVWKIQHGASRGLLECMKSFAFRAQETGFSKTTFLPFGFQTFYFAKHFGSQDSPSTYDPRNQLLHRVGCQFDHFSSQRFRDALSQHRTRPGCVS